jgi:predicted transposase YdaD
MMNLPKELAELAWKEIRDFAKEQNMPYITAAERVGREEGLAEGLAKGRQEGLAIGARGSLLAGIEVALELRFAVSGLALLPEIREIEDVDLLRKILSTIKQASSPETLRQLWLNA